MKLIFFFMYITMFHNTPAACPRGEASSSNAGNNPPSPEIRTELLESWISQILNQEIVNDPFNIQYASAYNPPNYLSNQIYDECLAEVEKGYKLERPVRAHFIESFLHKTWSSVFSNSSQEAANYFNALMDSAEFGENVYMPSTKHFCENDQKLVEPSFCYDAILKISEEDQMTGMEAYKLLYKVYVKAEFKISKYFSIRDDVLETFNYSNEEEKMYLNQFLVLQRFVNIFSYAVTFADKNKLLTIFKYCEKKADSPSQGQSNWQQE